MNLTATVLHNVSMDMFTRFHPKTSKLYHAHTFEIVADGVEQGANLIWLLANVGDADELRLVKPEMSRYASQVTAYRRRGNRSLSVSDVLVFHEGQRPAGTLVVVSVGHEPLEFIPAYQNGSNETARSASYAAHEEFRETFGRW